MPLPTMSLRTLRWFTIAFPIAFLIVADVLRNVILPDPFHSLPGALLIYLIAGIAVATFSIAIFGLIEALERTREEQNRQLAALNSMAVAATENVQLDDMLSAGLEHVMRAMDADCGMICLVDLSREEHSAVCVRGFSEELASRVQQAKLRDDPIASEVVSTGRAVLVERVMNDPRVAEAASREGISSLISAPLQAGGEVNGILVIATHEERSFSAADQVFFEGIGGQLGMLIRNATLYEDSMRQNRDLSALVAVGEAISASIELEDVLRHSLDTIIAITSADAAEIWLLEDDTLVMRCHRGTHGDAFLERTRFAVGEGLPGVVAATGEPMVAHDLASDRRFLRKAVVREGFQTFAALPLRYRGALVGVLAVAARSNAAVDATELRLLGAIGEQITPAVENARLNRQIEDAAVLQERERISREMHDGLSQVLGYVNTQALAVRKLIADGRLNVAVRELVKLEEAARSTYADVREGILGLRTAPRHTDGLAGALSEYVTGYHELSGIEAHFEVTPEAGRLRLPPAAEIQLIRIVQEALSNVRKHSGATEVWVTFDQDASGLRIVVADTGQGFDSKHLGSAGRPRFGLQTMRERAESIGGAFAIETAPGRGTRVIVRLPIAEASAMEIRV